MALRFRDANNPAGISRLINSRIDAALETERAGEIQRDYLGASVLGDPCDRRLGYQYAGVEHDPLAGRSLRIFEFGHAAEALVSRWLRLAGFDLQDLDPSTGRQWEFTAGEGRVRGHLDGIIVAGPAIGAAFPIAWEAKALNAASWTDLATKGSRNQSPDTSHKRKSTWLSSGSVRACSRH